jgi:hypothetical protein
VSTRRMASSLQTNAISSSTRPTSRFSVIGTLPTAGVFSALFHTPTAVSTSRLLAAPACSTSRRYLREASFKSSHRRPSTSMGSRPSPTAIGSTSSTARQPSTSVYSTRTPVTRPPAFATWVAEPPHLVPRHSSVSATNSRVGG